MNEVIETNRRELKVREIASPGQFSIESNSGPAGVPPIQWSWACRKLASGPSLLLEEDFETPPPRPGDIALVQVSRAGFHKYLTTADNRRLRIYPGDHFVGVFGNRYASGAYEGAVQGLD